MPTKSWTLTSNISNMWFIWLLSRDRLQFESYLHTGWPSKVGRQTWSQSPEKLHTMNTKTKIKTSLYVTSAMGFSDWNACGLCVCGFLFSNFNSKIFVVYLASDMPCIRYDYSERRSFKKKVISFFFWGSIWKPPLLNARRKNGLEGRFVGRQKTNSSYMWFGWNSFHILQVCDIVTVLDNHKQWSAALNAQLWQTELE